VAAAGQQTETAGAFGRASRRLLDSVDVVFAIGVLIAIGIGLTFASPYFLTTGNLTNVLLQAAVLAIVSFGVTVVIISGNFDLSVGSGVGFVGICAGSVMIETQSIPLGILVGLGCGVAVGLTNGIIVTIFRVPSFIATLAMLVILRGSALAITNGETVSGFPEGFANFMSDTFLGLRNAVWIAIGVLVVLHVILRHTRLGVQIYAAGGNAEAARLSGLPVWRIRTAAYVLSGLSFAVAGLVLLGRLDAAQPTAGELLELYSVAAVVLGGTSLFGGHGSVLRTVVGVLIIAVIQNGLSLLNVDPDLQNVVLGAVFIVAASSGFLRRGT
jgi:ribose transport system permease protein